MVRIASVNIPDKKRLVIALTYIYGIGKATAQKICDAARISVDKKVHDLNDEELKLLRDEIDNNCDVESDLRRMVGQNIKNQKDLGTYRGRRHIMRLPTRGQNTHSNAQTAKRK